MGASEEIIVPATPRKNKWSRANRVVDVHSHFHINRNIHDAHEGPITREEQIKALERFVNWHTRQVAVGQIMLTTLKVEDAQAAQSQASPQTEVPAGPAAEGSAALAASEA